MNTIVSSGLYSSHSPGFSGLPAGRDAGSYVDAHVLPCRAPVRRQGAE